MGFPPTNSNPDFAQFGAKRDDNNFWVKLSHLSPIKSENDKKLKKKQILIFYIFFTQKCLFLEFFVFEISISWPKSDRLPKICDRVCQMPKVFNKTILVTLGQKLTEKIHNLDPPLPIDPYYSPPPPKKKVRCDLTLHFWPKCAEGKSKITSVS